MLKFFLMNSLLHFNYIVSVDTFFFPLKHQISSCPIRIRVTVITEHRERWHIHSRSHRHISFTWLCAPAKYKTMGINGEGTTDGGSRWTELLRKALFLWINVRADFDMLQRHTFNVTLMHILNHSLCFSFWRINMNEEHAPKWLCVCVCVCVWEKTFSYSCA